MSKNRRSDQIVMTNEARVLRDLRIKSKLSMKKAGELIGRSDSYIAHIETGRMNPPTEDKLDRLLAIYGGIKQKSYFERVRKYSHSSTPLMELHDLLNRLNEQQAETALILVKSLLKKDHST